MRPAVGGEESERDLESFGHVTAQYVEEMTVEGVKGPYEEEGHYTGIWVMYQAPLGMNSRTAVVRCSISFNIKRLSMILTSKSRGTI